MQLSRKHISYAIVLTVCVGALLVDRAFLLPNQAAANDGTADYAVATPVETEVPAPMPLDWLEDGGVSELARRLESHVAAGVEDAFRVPWSTAVIPSGGPSVAAEQFRMSHRLEGLLAAGPKGHVVVSGASMQMGDTIDGWTLVEIAERKAIFENASGERLELAMPRRTGGR